ncbi:MAG TPA: hypothetical protein DDY98_08810 [Ruminococcaceae bacterium]|nr:hypothetical protein [Oscillospiraceae bacterium]
MKKIVDSEIYGLLPVEGGFFYITPTRLPDGKVKGEFYGYEVQSGNTIPITKWAYFQSKFGNAYKEITSQIKDYVSCECGILAGGEAVLLYPDGDLGVFNSRGLATFTGKLEYHEETVNGVAPDGRNFWGVVPTMNSVICYSIDDRRVQMRIGSPSSSAFEKPVAIAHYGDSLFICNEKSCKVRTVSLSDYSVADYLKFDEPVKRFFAADEKEFVLLESGLYQL